VDSSCLYVSTTFLRDKSSLKEALIECRNQNINSVELGSNHCYSDQFEQITGAFDFKYLVHNYFPIPKTPFVLNIASSDTDIYSKSIKHVFNSIDFCAKINAKLYTFHPGFITDPIGANETEKDYNFRWDSSHPNKTKYKVAYDNMLRGINTIVEYALKKKVRIAIETEGSFNKNQFLLLQFPEEYERFFREFDSDSIGINLNIGHLNLASKAFHFNISDFINYIKDYVVAMELSHNNGSEDQHLPLVSGAWYWPIILDTRFKSSFKILEFRNCSIDKIVKNFNLVIEYQDEI
jgi:sugar phosphate isomerase/epimerase